MNFHEMMEELKAEYIEALPQKISDIEGNYTRRDVDCLREDFHKLKGTGKTYGLPEISVLGEVVEKICLHRPQQISVVIPYALALLRDIHSQRVAAQEFEIYSDSRFHQMQAVLQSAS